MSWGGLPGAMVRLTAYSAIGALAAIKLLLILAFGPLIQPDSSGYITFAETILSDSTSWLVDRPAAGGEDSYRMIGYPALIALAKLALGDSWGYGVVVAQAALSLLATACVYRLVGSLSGCAWPAFACAAAFAGSPVLVYDLHILTDGLYGSVTAITLALLAGAALDRSDRLRPFLLVGGLLALAFLVREFTLYLMVALLPLAFVAVWRGVARPGSRATAIVCLLVPLMVVAAGYMSWNAYRSGDPYLTTAARTAALLPLVRLAERGVPVFDRYTALDAAARRQLSSYTYDDVLAINRDFQAQAIAPLTLDKLARDRFYAILAAHPVAFAGHVWRELDLPQRLGKLTNPVRALRDVNEFGHGRLPIPFVDRLRADLASGSVPRIALAALSGAITLVVLVLGVLAAFIFPVLFVLRLTGRGSEIPPGWYVMAGLWAAYFGTACLYALIRLEDRYVLGVAPYLLLVGLCTAWMIWTHRQVQRA